MAAIVKRLTPPENIVYLWNAIVSNQSQNNPNYAPMAKVMKYLVHDAEYTNSQAEELVANSIEDGLVIGSYTQTGNKSLKGIGIPKLEKITIDENSYDWYCYECHKPSVIDLQRCSQCLRSYHSNCWRIDPDKPNDSDSVVPNRRHVEKSIGGDEHSSQQILNNTSNEQQAATSEINVEDDQENGEEEITEGTETPNSTAEVILTIHPRTSQESPERDEKNNINDVNETKSILIQAKIDDDADDDEDSKNDIKLSHREVIYVGEVRPPSRRRRDYRSQSFKPENNESVENENQIDKALCSHCRVMKKSKLRDPPNMNNEEISYLLRFVFERTKSWVINVFLFLHLNNYSVANKGAYSEIHLTCEKYFTRESLTLF